jgi:hypothetical protein
MADAAPDAPARLGGGRDHHPGRCNRGLRSRSRPTAGTGRVRREAEAYEVQRSLFSVPGREIVQVLTEIPVGVESGWHTHPGE